MLAAAADAVVVVGPASAVTSALAEAPGLAQSGSPYAPLIFEYYCSMRFSVGKLGSNAGRDGGTSRANADHFDIST